MKLIKEDIIFWIALLLAIWFVVSGMFWVYYICLFVAYPAALISLALWKIGKKNDTKNNRYKWIPRTLLVGLFLSMTVLLYLLIFE